MRTAYIALAASALRPDDNVIQGRIHRRMFHDDFVQYIVDWPPGQLIVRRPPTDLYEEGVAVALSFAAEHCVLLQD